MSFRDEIDDLKYFCSKEYRKSGSKEKSNSTLYRILAVAWVAMIVNIIPLVLVWTLFSVRVPFGLKMIYTVLSLLLAVFGIGAWFVVTKKK